MKATGFNAVIDSSVWIEYFFVGSGKTKEYMESGDFFLFCSAISLHEVKKKLLREKYSSQQIEAALGFMKNNSSIVDITEEICEKSALDAVQLKLHTADSIIYRTALKKNAKIITLDEDFRNIKDAIVL